MSVSGSVTIDFNLTDTRAVGLATGVRNNPRITQTLNFSDGTGAGAGNTLYGVSRTIPGGGDDDVDLSGALADAFNGTIANARIKAIVVYNPASNDTLTVGGGTNPATTIVNGTVPVHPDGFFALATRDATAHAITAGTADVLRVAGTAGQSYTLGFLGANA